MAGSRRRGHPMGGRPCEQVSVDIVHGQGSPCRGDTCLLMTGQSTTISPSLITEVYLASRARLNTGEGEP
jgi:hypothetical protein